MKLTPRHKAFHWAVFGSIAVIAVFVLLFGKDFARDRRTEEALREIEETERLLAEDTYGGDTPEETFAMFLDALRAGDVDLASKYFVAEKQEGWKKTMTTIASQGKLIDLVKELESIPSKWQESASPISERYKKYVYKRMEETSFKLNLPDGRGGTIQQEFPAGEYNDEIIFLENARNRKWKIDAL